jgi:hypothetical protein
LKSLLDFKDPKIGNPLECLLNRKEPNRRKDAAAAAHAYELEQAAALMVEVDTLGACDSTSQKQNSCTQKLTGLISLHTNPVSISTVPFQAVH